jgi:hypothetical protein
MAAVVAGITAVEAVDLADIAKMSTDHQFYC